MLKQDSQFYEWYQKELAPWKHFVPFDGSEADLLSKLDWAKQHDDEAQQIADTGDLQWQPLHACFLASAAPLIPKP